MTKCKLKLVAVAAYVLVLSGCWSSPEDKVYEAFKCAKAATLLERPGEGDIAMQKVIPYMKQMEAEGGSLARRAMLMSERFQDDVPLYAMTTDSQVAVLSRIYQSGKCQSFYKVEAVQASANDSVADLSGCEVPLGGALDESKKSECAKTEPVVNQSGAATSAESKRPPVATPDDAVIEGAIAVTASTVMGDEFKDARQVVAGDINGDKVDDSAVLFSIEIPSENTSTQYLAVFLRQPDGSLRFANALPVGGVGSSTSDFVIADETIRLTALTLGPDDSNCCPTLEQKTKYLLHNGKLKLVN